MNNALKYVKILESTGITREQAEAHVQIITDITEGELATKQDLQNLDFSLKQDISKTDTAVKRLEQTLKQDIKNLESKLDTSIERIEHKMLQSEYRLTIKLGTIVTLAIAAATTVIKLV